MARSLAVPCGRLASRQEDDVCSARHTARRKERCPHADADAVIVSPYHWKIPAEEAPHRFFNTCTIEEIIEARPRDAWVEQRVLQGFPAGYTTVTRERNEVFVFYGTEDPSTCTDEAELAGRCTFGPMTAKIDADTFTVVGKKLLYNTKVLNAWD